MISKNLFLKFINYSIKAKAVWLRGAISFSIGLAVLYITDNTQYDSRFKIRGEQSYNQSIQLLYINSKVLGFKNRGSSNSWITREAPNNNNNSYWDQKVWKKLLDYLIKSEADKIIINFRFNPSLVTNQYTPIFSNKKIFWSSGLDEINKSTFLKEIQIYPNELISERDGIVRYFKNTTNKNTHIIEKVFPQKNIQENTTINFRGQPGTFRNQVINLGQLPAPSTIKGKIIIIGTESLASHFLETPIGKMNTSEILANVIDNTLEDRWIYNLSFKWSLLYLASILFIAMLVMFSFPQSVALTYLLWSIAGICALSLALFDNLYFWLPFLAPIFLIASTYVFFLSYLLNEKENNNWKLQEEQKIQSKSQQLKNNFVSLISHDLKTPIAKIQGICDRILSQNPDPKLINDLSIVKAETEELNRYIQSILQITKVESKDFKIQKKPVDVNKVIEKVLSHLKFLLIENENKIEQNLEPLFLIEADPILIYEVFLNILENSIKYAPKTNILIKTYETDNFVHIVFTDNGPGISENDLKFVFEKFYRAKDQKNLAKGSGLGLYLVKYFIQLHNGTINISSQLGAGTEVHIKLPIES